MAATAAAAVASSFSSSIQSLHCIRSKSYPSDSFLKFSPSRSLPIASTSQFHGIESILIGPLGNKWRLPKIAAAVAQEEATAAAETVVAPVEEAAVAEEEKVIEEVEEETGGEEIPVDTSTKLYFGNLPYHVDSAQLAGIIQDFGSPELVEVLYDRDTGKSRGFAFVTMSSIEDCNTVIQNLDGREYGGRTLRVNFSDKPRAKEPLYPETEYKLFVGNLSWSVTTESLAEAFQECGDVIGARVLYDGETGRSRGYGFVCFKTQAEMDAALNNLNGVELEGRAIRVSLAEGKKQ